MNETLPKDYGDLRGEYDAIRGGVAVIDLSNAGKLQVSGKNSVQFLNGLISNDVNRFRRARECWRLSPRFRAS